MRGSANRRVKTLPLFNEPVFWHAAVSRVSAQHKSKEGWQGPPLFQPGGKSMVSGGQTIFATRLTSKASWAGIVTLWRMVRAADVTGDLRWRLTVSFYMGYLGDIYQISTRCLGDLWPVNLQLSTSRPNFSCTASKSQVCRGVRIGRDLTAASTRVRTPEGTRRTTATVPSAPFVSRAGLLPPLLMSASTSTRAGAPELLGLRVIAM